VLVVRSEPLHRAQPAIDGSEGSRMGDSSIVRRMTVGEALRMAADPAIAYIAPDREVAASTSIPL